MSFDPFMWFLLSELDAADDEEERDSYGDHWSDDSQESDSDHEDDD